MPTDSTSTITLVRVAADDALYHRYPGQHAPQSVHVSLDCDTGRLLADYNAEIGNGVPSNVWHRRTLRWSIPALTADVANTLLDEIVPLAERVVAGYECAWDGHNHVGKYDADAEAAIEAIEALCSRGWGEGEVIEVWDAADWYAATGSANAQRRELGITATTTDAELEALVEREEEEASPRSIEGLAKHLTWLRDGAAPDSDAAAP